MTTHAVLHGMEIRPPIGCSVSRTTIAPLDTTRLDTKLGITSTYSMTDQPRVHATKKIPSITDTETPTQTFALFFRMTANVTDATIYQRTDVIEFNVFPTLIHNTSTTEKSLEMPKQITHANLTKKKERLRLSILLWIVKVIVNVMIEIRRLLILVTGTIEFVCFRPEQAYQYERLYELQ